MFIEIGPHNFRRIYRMTEASFFQLFDLLQLHLPQIHPRAGAAPNGFITMQSRLAMALRWCAGGYKYDIGANHGVHPDEVYKSLWVIVDSIHSCKAFDIELPASHRQQQQMVIQFQQKSGCGFWNCVAAVDGILVWTCKPYEETDDMGIGPMKFMSGRKNKFGLHMQGTCGPNKKFLDVTCCHPGSASDYTM